MVDGRLKCIGTEQHLKNKYGHGYQLEVRLAGAESEQMQPLLEQLQTLCIGDAALDENGKVAGAEGAASLKLPKTSLEEACKRIGNGNGERYNEFSRPGSSSWVLQDQIAAESEVDLVPFVEWWMNEDNRMTICQAH